MGVVPVARQQQVPQRLRAGFLADELDTALGVPLLTAHAPRAHLTLYLDAVVVLLRDPANDLPVVFVAVPPLGKNGRGALKLGVLSAGLRSSYVGVDDELADVVGRVAVRDVSEHLVKMLELLLPSRVLNHAPVFPQASEVEVASDCRRDDEGGLARGRRQLLEVLL